MPEATLAPGAPQSGAPSSPASIPVPTYGGGERKGGDQVIDPTKNVLDLVQAESKYQNSMRESEARYQNSLRDSDNRRQDELALYRERLASQRVKSEVRRQDDLAHYREEMTKCLREAETRRHDDLGSQKNSFDKMQADLLRAQVADNAAVLSSQLDKMTTVMSERLSKLEQFRYETSGKGGGVTMVIGYLLAFATLAITIVVTFVKLNPS